MKAYLEKLSVPDKLDRWQQQWVTAQVILHDKVHKINQTLVAEGKKSRCVLYLVDAANLNNLKKLSENYDQIFVISDHRVQTEHKNVFVYQLPVDFYGAYYLDSIPENKTISRQFNCFINRCDPVRQSWFYSLYLKGWLDSGYVSFNLYAGYKPGHDGHLLDEKIKLFNDNHDKWLRSLDHVKQDIKNIVPFKNFDESADLCDLILESKFSLVLETYTERTDCQTLTEKTWRAIQLPRPFLIFAATGCVNRLRQMGFDLFDEYVNHDYDQYDTRESHSQRHDAIMIEADRLYNYQVTNEVIADWEKRATHNRNILRQWHNNWLTKCVDHVEMVARLALEQ